MPIEVTGSRTYLLCFLILVLSSMAILVATAIYVEPLDGELTRIGGYAEREFGWNQPRKTLGGGHQLSNRYDQYYDIVVLGDSFSKPGLWQSFLKQATGFSFTTLHWDGTSLADILNNDVFKRTPPKLLIVESGVRYLPQRFTGTDYTCLTRLSVASHNTPSFEPNETRIEFTEISRIKETPFAEINLKFAMLFLKKNLMRLALNTDFGKVKKYPLTRNDLFSSNNSQALLVMQTWFEKRVWTKAELTASTCAVLDAQLRVQSNNKTHFILLPIPDKATAYANYIKNKDFDFVSMAGINQMMTENKVNSPRVDLLLQNAIDKGEKDIYLPNDTHFGSRGYELTAISIVDFLKAGTYWDNVR
jgi:hypothetical protein